MGLRAFRRTPQHEKELVRELFSPAPCYLIRNVGGIVTTEQLVRTEEHLEDKQDKANASCHTN
jgi:hypothetical protein